jgi:hypothetical protein
MKPSLTYLRNPRPERWTARETDFGVELVCAEPITSKLASMFMVALVLVIMIIYLSQVATGTLSDLAFLLGLLLALYIFMVAVSNQITIQITDDELAIHTTPLPALGSRRKFLTGSLAKVHCQLNPRGRITTYTLWLTESDDTIRRALTFVRPDEALYAREFIATYCGIEEGAEIVNAEGNISGQPAPTERSGL